MEQHEIKNIFKRLSRLMRGRNYVAYMGLEIFDICSTEDDFKRSLKKEFPDSQPDNVLLIEVTQDEFWEEIQFAFSFRGDSSSGFNLSKEQEASFKNDQEKCFAFLKENIDSTAKIFNYPDETGILRYPVHWDFQFLIMSADKKCLFIYGEASD